MENCFLLPCFALGIYTKSFIHFKNYFNMQTILEKRRARVERLTAQALKDSQPHKYIQGRFILAEIDRRTHQLENYRTLFINQIRGNA